MTKSEFMQRLEQALTQKKIADVGDILSEYEEHFAFKLADGFTQEEIAAKLGNPAAIAQQFALETEKPARGGRAVATAGLCVTGFGAGLFFILLAAWGVVLAAFCLCCAAAAFSLMARLSPWGLIPSLPYGCAVLCGVALAALSALSAVGCVWFCRFLRQMARAYGRFHHNTLASAAGNPGLPALPVYPSFPPRAKRRLRRAALVALSVFAVFFILGVLVCMLCAGDIQFWHAWGWFGFA